MQNRPFIIAKMSGNHNKSLERALKIVKDSKIDLQDFKKDVEFIKSMRVLQ